MISPQNPLRRVRIPRLLHGLMQTGVYVLLSISTWNRSKRCWFSKGRATATCHIWIDIEVSSDSELAIAIDDSHATTKRSQEEDVRGGLGFESVHLRLSRPDHARMLVCARASKSRCLWYLAQCEVADSHYFAFFQMPFPVTGRSISSTGTNLDKHTPPQWFLLEGLCVCVTRV